MKKWKKILATAASTLALVAGTGGLTAFSPVQAAGESDAISDEDLNNYISHMTLDEKIGQMFISRTPQDTTQARQDVAKYHLGGLIVYGTDFTSVPDATAFKAKIQSFQDAADLPLFIAVDQEGGKVSRISDNPKITDYRTFPSPQNLYKAGGMTAVVNEAEQTGAILKDLGINWNFAPVADSTPETSAFIYPRTIGLNYGQTADYIKQVVPAWQKNVASSLKHFPGYGSAIDTHTDFATVTKSKAEFEAQDLLPFKAGIETGVDSIMIAHIMMQSVDSEYPSSLSRKVITDLLRNELGYEGVIITDGLGMGAITAFAKSHADTPVDVMAAMAGNDGIMNNDYAKAIPQIKAAVEAGKISEAEINQHVFRLLSLKRKRGLLPKEIFESKKVKIDKVTYDNKAKTAKVDGTVVASDFPIGDPIYAKTVDGANVGETVIGANGKFTMTIPLKDEKQTLIITTGMPGIETANLTLNALEVKLPGTGNGSSTGGGSNGATVTPPTSGSSSTTTNNQKPGNQFTGGSGTTGTATQSSGNLPQTGERKSAALITLGLLATIAAGVGGYALYKKRAA